MNNQRILIIAEVGQAHDGSLGIAHSYIDALSTTGIDAIKFQTHIAEAESSLDEPFRVKFSYEDNSRYDYWKRMEFTAEQWLGLKNHCSDKGLEFISSPFSNAAVDLLEGIGVSRYKVGSGEVNNHLLLEKIGRTGKPVILSSGMSSMEEVRRACSLLAGFGSNVSIMQCTTAYPTSPQQWGLNVIQRLRNETSLPVGFSDHSGDIYACLAATALGAVMLEFHVTFDKRMFGPDTLSSITIDQVSSLVKGVRDIETAFCNPLSKDDTMTSFGDLKRIFGKSLAVNKDLVSGHVIEFEDLEGKKPSVKGINAAEYRSIIGKKTKRDLPAFSFLNYEDLE